MNTNRQILFFTLILLQFIFILEINCQNFKVSSLIELSGDNIEFNVLSAEMGIPDVETYICWINKLDSVYTVYLKQISPELGDDIVVSSDVHLKSNPHVALNRYSQGIKIVWQSYNDNIWQVLLKNYSENQLSESTLIIDSLETNPQISLNIHRIAWIENSKLLIMEFYPDLSNPIIIDSANNSSPNLIRDDNISFTQILYQKDLDENHLIYLAKYLDHTNPKWSFETISTGNNRCPNFGLGGGISFETIENQFSSITFSAYGSYQFMNTMNENSNYKNSIVFSYPVPTNQSENKSPFFVAFDTDSLENNKEIFIKTFYFGEYYSLINLSNCEGNDFNPNVAYLSSGDTVFISVIWQHTQNEKSDIWIAKDIFSPILSEVKNKRAKKFSFDLTQNYPNPFNPSTTIKYTIPLANAYNASTTNVTLKIYDILGKEVATLVNKEQKPGSYEVKFDADDLPSGMYLYKIQAGEFLDVKKMLLLK